MKLIILKLYMFIFLILKKISINSYYDQLSSYYIEVSTTKAYTKFWYMMFKLYENLKKEQKWMSYLCLHFEETIPKPLLIIVLFFSIS